MSPVHPARISARQLRSNPTPSDRRDDLFEPLGRRRSMGHRSGSGVSLAPNTRPARDAALADFDRAREEFEEAVRRAPDAALRPRGPGADNALGGLVVPGTQDADRDTRRRHAS